MIHILLTGNVEKGKWIAAFRLFEKQEEASKWFRRLPKKRRRNEAITTLLPHQYISGDAITYCLAALQHKPPQGTYIYDVLVSAATEAQIWNIFWRIPRTKQNKKISAIILPINVQNIHWYVAILYLDNVGVKLNIQNDIGMRNKTAEDKLMKIGTKYHQKMWAQVPIPKNMITPMKKTSSKIQPQEKSFEKILYCNI